MKEKINQMKETFMMRLQNARKMLGLSQAELAERTEELERKDPSLFKSVSSTSVERYEKGIMFPESDSIMLALAKSLDMHPEDLLRPITVNIDHSKFEFRKKSKLGKKAVEAIKLKISERIEKYIEIERIAGDTPKFTNNIRHINVATAEEARFAANLLRHEWNLGDGPIAQPILVLESNGVKVIEVDEDPELFDGTSIIVEGVPVVVLNKNDQPTGNAKHQNNEERRRLTLFHELGHKMMNIPEEIQGKEREDLCNVFANEMLIPSKTFTSIFGNKRQMISSWELKDVQHEFGISVRALMKKAEQLGVISKSRYTWFCVSMNKSENEGLRRMMDATATEPQHTSRYKRLVYRCLSSEVITTSKAAQMLNIPISELRKTLNLESNNGYNS